MNLRDITSALLKEASDKIQQADDLDDWVLWDGAQALIASTTWQPTENGYRELYPDFKNVGTVSEALKAIEDDHLLHFLSSES